jgi:gamma-glutamyltranspeptidase/glutathione hydrolase
MRQRVTAFLLGFFVIAATASAGSQPVWARNGMVVTQQAIASRVGRDVLASGGNAVDAAVATAFALAVVHPAAGNIGGGGFLVYRPAHGTPAAYDFREQAPEAASATMFLDADGNYASEKHHDGHLAVGVPGTVAGLHMAWSEQGSLPWKRLVEPAIRLADDGFVVSEGLARSLKRILPELAPYPASVAQFSREGLPYEGGDRLEQPDLARSLRRVAEQGPAGFYEGETARLIEEEMRANGGLITRGDLAAYRAKRWAPLVGTYRGYEVLSMPPISSGGVVLIQMLNVLEGYDVAGPGFRSAASVHRIAEAMRRAFANRALHLGDPEVNPEMPVARLISKAYAAELRGTIGATASKSSPESFEWPAEGTETTHLSVVDGKRNAVSLTYTLEQGYGSGIVVPGAGFLLNNEMGDFNAGPGLTDAKGLIGTEPNLAAPRKRMLSSMTPTILAKDGELFMVVGSPGGRTIINTVLLTILNVVDHGMNIQEAIDAPRFHHQWLPDRIRYERRGLSPDTLALLAQRGHTLQEIEGQGSAQGIVFDAEADMLEGGADRRSPDSAAVGH